jgi:hypothetical protein
MLVVSVFALKCLDNVVDEIAALYFSDRSLNNWKDDIRNTLFDNWKKQFVDINKCLEHYTSMSNHKVS